MLRRLFGSWTVVGRLLKVDRGLLSAVARGKRKPTPQVVRALQNYTVWRVVNADLIEGILSAAEED